jgi:hypothetical protein
LNRAGIRYNAMQATSGSAEYRAKKDVKLTFGPPETPPSHSRYGALNAA